MGSTIWTEVRGVPLSETAEDSGKMKRLAEELDAIAVRLGAAKVSHFFDYSEMAREADTLLEELEGGNDVGDDAAEGDEVETRDVTAESVAEREGAGEWFDSATGLATVRALVQYLAAHPDELPMPTHPSDVGRYRSELLDELRRCEAVLARAASSGKQFRFLLVP